MKSNILLLISWCIYTTLVIKKSNVVKADTTEMNEIDSFWKSKNWRKENEQTLATATSLLLSQKEQWQQPPSIRSKTQFRCYHGGIMYRDHVHAYDESIMLNILPECLNNGEIIIISLNKHNIKLANENDILFYHDNSPRRWSFNDFNPHEFPGKVLFIVEEWRRSYMFTDIKNNDDNNNGNNVNVTTIVEARNNCPEHRYYIGSMADSSCSMYVPLLSMYVQDLSISDRNKLFNPKYKQMNTKEHFLIYIASHRVKHREEAFFKIIILIIRRRGSLWWIMSW